MLRLEAGEGNGNWPEAENHAPAECGDDLAPVVCHGNQGGDSRSRLIVHLIFNALGYFGRPNL